MLKKIRIHNLAVVEDVELSLEKGLNVLTGSTGAGKSLILGAVNLLQGKKATISSIRSGEERAVVECEFALETGAAVPVPVGFPVAEDGIVRLRREIRRNGRSYAFVNGESVPVKQLQSVCSQMIEPHGQNEQFRLKDPDNHVGYVDVFAGNEELIEKYQDALREYKIAAVEVESFNARLAVIKEKQELLNHRVEEIERAGITEGEIQELDSRIKLLENSEKIFDALNFVYAALDDDESGAAPVVAQVLKQLSKIDGLDKTLSEISSSLKDAELTLRDCADDVRSYLDNVQFDPQQLQTMQERRAYLLALERRYDMSLEELVRAQKQWASELETAVFEKEERRALDEKLSTKTIALEKSAKALRASRKFAAQNLDKAVNHELEDLMMPGARFRTSVGYEPDPLGPVTVNGESAAAGSGGADKIRFLIRTNQGEKEGPVDEIASTGEISRIALALKKITNLGRTGSVLIFDELDAGVGADLAGPISEKLLDLSDHYQIICITHLPQIAAKGRRHLVVTKRSAKDRTYAEVFRVEGDDRRREIARMLGGKEGSEKRMALADEMLDNEDTIRRSNDVRPYP